METETTARIREAIAAGDYPQASSLWNAYSAQLEEAIGTASLSEPAFRDLRELVEWSRTTLQCARSHLLDDLNTLHVAEVYVRTGR